MDKKVESIVEQTLDTWAELLVKQFPNLETGDLTPFTTMRLSSMLEEATREWICLNVPRRSHGKTT